MSESRFLAEQIGGILVGFQITESLYDPESDSVGFRCQRDPHGEEVKELEVWVDRDPEGNGPGWLSIQKG